MNQKKHNDVLNPELVHLNVQVSSKEELIAFMAQKLVEKGAVRPSFEAAVLMRERHYPTGLQTISVPVAIPHTDREHVIRSAISFATLKEPVTFKMMGSTDQFVDVEAVFMLAIDNNEGQLSMLQNIMGILVNKEVLTALKNAQNQMEVIDLLEQQLCIEAA